MKKSTALLFSLLALLLLMGTAAAQPNKVVGMPQPYSPPMDSEGLENKTTPETDNPWIVVCDRSANPTYESPQSDKVIQTLEFRDYFYVCGEVGEWIWLCKADVTGKKITPGTFQNYGWVQKSKMLLWTQSLLDATTRIHKKVFFLNKVQDIQAIVRMDKPQDVQIYFSPNGAPSPEPKSIYEYYFVYKYDKENLRYLVGKDDKFSTHGIKSCIVGWVDVRRAVEWNTRIALEPNFDSLAFAERKATPNFQVNGFSNFANAKSHSASGTIERSDAYWNDDPVTLKKEQLGSDHRRFKGQVVRFPLLNCPSGGAYYRSGVVGEITYQTAKGALASMDEIYYANLVEEMNQKKIARDYYDILFVVEGTKRLADYRPAIADAMRRMKNKLIDVPHLRFGLTVYRDVDEESAGKLCDKTIKFTEKPDDIIEALNKAEFAGWGQDNDSWTAMYYGLKEGLMGSGINTEHTTVVVLIGTGGNYSDSPPRLERDKAHKTNLSEESIVELLADRKVHMIAIQCQNPDRASKKFQEQARNLILQSATTQFQIYKNIDLVDGKKTAVDNPDMQDLSEGNELWLEGSSVIGLLCKPATSSALSPDDIASALEKSAGKVLVKVNGMFDKLRLIIEEGGSFSEINPGDFAEPMFAMFSDMIAQGKITKEDLKKMVSKKYKLYAEVFFARQIAEAKSPAFSLVLFMPESDLKHYLEVLEKLKLAENRSPDQMRTALYNTLVEIASQYTGNRIESIREMSVDQLRNEFNGIEGETCGLPGGKWGKIKIGDIPKRMKDEEVKKHINDILDATTKLSTFLTDNYEFRMKTANDTYYWIPLEYTF